MLQSWRLFGLSLSVFVLLCVATCRSFCCFLFLRVLIMEGRHCQRASLEFPTWEKYLDFKKEQEEMLFLSFSLRREGRKTQDGKLYKSFQCCHHGHSGSWCVASVWFSLCCCITVEC